jgi:type IV pilus assembly protein PilW
MNQVDNRYGYLKNDLVIIGEAGKQCSLRQISNLPAGAGVGLQLEHNGLRYNKAGGMQVAYSTWDNTAASGGRVYTLGQAPAVMTYSIANSQLQGRNLLLGTAASPLVDGIVQLQAEYGKDTNADGDVDAWNTTAPTNADEWASVIAVRIAVVARSETAEKPNPTTFLCDVTTSAPTWKGGTAIVLTADPNWQCYRYRTFETVVPVRNQIWKPE